MSEKATSPGRFATGLILVLAVGAIVRAGYLLSLPASDPCFAYPILDGAYYTEWARALLAGSAPSSGAYYLAPLPGFWLAAIFAIFGPSPFAVAAVNLALSILAAAAAGCLARKVADDASGWVAAAMLLAYQPFLFFAARPLGESLAIALLLSGALAWFADARRAALGSGVLWGLASLARPNLLLVPLVAGAYELFRRDRRRAVLLIGGLAVIVAPVAVRNFVSSGHLVPVSANGGVTLFHGNGPGARGTFQPAEGLSGSVVAQRDEATALARARTGRPLDDVEADAWWGREALRTRIADPLGTAVLLARKLGLAFDNAEHGLDYAPRLDADPWRWAAPVPFAALLALTVFYFAVTGVREVRAQRLLVVLAAAGAVLPVFYVSSRYRLPFATFLTVPAAAGLVLALGGGTTGARSRSAPRLAAMAALVLSLSFPSHETLQWSDAIALANGASARRKTGDLAGAESDLRHALALDPDSVPVLYNLGVVLNAKGDQIEAEAMYRRALAIDPASAEVAGNLASLLIGSHRPGEAVPPLRAALARRPADRACWTNLVVALAAGGARAEAMTAAAEAKRRGVTLDPELLREIGGGDSGTMMRRSLKAILAAGIIAAAGCGRSTTPAAPTLAGSWSRGNDRLTSILAFYDDGDGLRFRWSRLASDGKRKTDCDWDGACVEKIHDKVVGEYRCVFEPGATPDTGSVRCSGWLDEGRRTELSWTDDFVADADGRTLRCYSREINGQRYEGDARPLRLFAKVGDDVAYPPKRARS